MISAGTAASTLYFNNIIPSIHSVPYSVASVDVDSSGSNTLVDQLKVVRALQVEQQKAELIKARDDETLKEKSCMLSTFYYFANAEWHCIMSIYSVKFSNDRLYH